VPTTDLFPIPAFSAFNSKAMVTMERENEPTPREQRKNEPCSFASAIDERGLPRIAILQP